MNGSIWRLVPALALIALVQPFQCLNEVLAGEGVTENLRALSIFRSSESPGTIRTGLEIESLTHSVYGPSLDGLVVSPPQFLDQYGSPGAGGGMGGVASTIGVQGQQAFVILPSITVSERYDSNVFFTPAVPGLKREDFVTTVTPGLIVLRDGELMAARLNVVGFGEYYARNPEISYVGVNESFSLDFSKVTQRIDPRFKFFKISQTTTYSPQPPAFLSGDQQIAQAADADANLSPGQVFTKGIQSLRADTLQYGGALSGTYALTSRLDMRASYEYSRIEFGGSSKVPNATGSFSTRGNFFSAESHSATVSPNYWISSTDYLNVSGNFQRTNFVNVDAAYNSMGGTIGWARIAPEYKGGVSAGVARVVMEGGSVSGSGGAASVNTFSGSANLSWLGTSTITTVAYNAGISPSYYAQLGPLLSHMITLTTWRRLGVGHSISGGIYGSYSDVLNKKTFSSNANQAELNTSFVSFGTNLGFSYLLSPTWSMSILHTFQYFKGGPKGGGTGGVGNGFLGFSDLADHYTRNMVQISITKFGIY